LIVGYFLMAKNKKSYTNYFFSLNRKKKRRGFFDIMYYFNSYFTFSNEIQAISRGNYLVGQKILVKIIFQAIQIIKGAILKEINNPLQCCSVLNILSFHPRIYVPPQDGNAG
jgi:hypothetical protein